MREDICLKVQWVPHNCEQCGCLITPEYNVCTDCMHDNARASRTLGVDEAMKRDYNRRLREGFEMLDRYG